MTNLNGVVDITVDGLILARYVPASIAWQPGLSFFSAEEDYQQVGTWQYAGGKKLLAHAHNEVPRNVLWTQEVLYVRRGRLRAEIFDVDGCRHAELEVSAGDVLVLLRGGHGYEILEDGTQVLEVKNGPYLGAEADRRRL